VAQLYKGNDKAMVTCKNRGQPCVKIVPIMGTKNFISNETGNEMFGLWKNRRETEDVEHFARDLRKGRKRAYLIFCVNALVPSERHPFLSKLNGKLV